MTTKRPALPPFTIIPNDVIRSPQLTMSDKVIYAILLSYCDASKDIRRCSTNRRALASISRMSMSGVKRCLDNLKAAGLLKTSTKVGSEHVVYTINMKPNSSLCPDELRGRSWKPAIDYGNKLGGLRKNQRKTSSLFGTSKAPPVPSSRPKKADLLGGDQVGDCHSGDRGTATQVAEDCHLSDRGLPLRSHQEYKNTLEEQSKNIPPRSDELAGPHVALGRCASAPAAPRSDETPESFSCVPRDTTNNDNAHEASTGVEQPDEESELPIMGETPEQTKARLDNYWAKRGGRPPAEFDANKERGEDLRRQPSAMSGAEPQQRAPKGARKPKAVQEEEESLQQTVEDPALTKTVPSTVKGLYFHFCKAVKKKWPMASLVDLFGPGGANKKLLKFSSNLLRDHKPSDLYEMIQVLVDDYENFNDARIFMKYLKGIPTPTFEQLYTNTDTLKAFVGKGVTGPNARFSAYFQGYCLRYPEKSTPTAVENNDRPSSSIDELRERYNK